MYLLFAENSGLSIGIWFWIIFVIASLFLGWFGWNNRPFIGFTIVVWVLLLLLGIAQFGWPIK